MQVLESEPATVLLDGRYELHECVGVGGMSRVYRALDVSLGRTVAVKLMREDGDLLASPERVRTEMTVLASLSFPSLVKLLDGQVESGRPRYLVMEFVDGETLADRLQRGVLSSAEAAHLAGELASALHVVHGAGVVHRDVKPANILLATPLTPGGHPQVKLTDFGVAHIVDGTGVTADGTVIGTGAYLAPEQVRGEPAGPPADVYALGLVLLEALTGVRAYGHLSGIGAVMARLIDAPIVPGSVGTMWAGLLTRMLATDPAQRPAALDVAQAALALNGQTAPPTTAPASVAPVPVTSGIDLAPTQATPAPPIPVVPATPPPPVTRVLPLDSRAARRRSVSAARRPRRPRRAVVAAVSGAAAAVVAVGLGLGFGAEAAPPSHDPLSGLTVVVPEVSQETADSTVPAPAPVTVTDTSSSVKPAVAGDAKETAEADRAEAKAQREADRAEAKAEREADREQRKEQQNAAKENRKNG
ncbi:serine/threonine-protein kinase [Microbacterium sp. HJ5]